MRTNFQICLHEGPPINPDARLRNSRYDYNADKMDGFDKKDFIDKKDGVDKGGVVVGEKWGGVGGDDGKDEDGVEEVVVEMMMAIVQGCKVH